jgi:tetratricopeptide (TPR) repeat protein
LSPARELDATTVDLFGYCRHKLIDGLHSLYDLTGQTKHLVKAIEALEAAAESYRKVNMFSRIAECHWKSALFLDILDEHPKAAEKFRLASDDFKIAAEKLPRLSALYDDHSQYMLAWEEIERARYHHSRQEYAQAKESYERAAALHESTKKWSFLSANYVAWAQVENAEDLSQKERSKESIDAFREASNLFRDSETQMRERLAKIESPDEKQMVKRLIEAIEHRQGLCRARIALEEARVLDKGGNLSSASEKYGLVADMFAKIKQRLSTDQDRKEIELIITLSKAWKAMAKAEAESSPELYEEAAHLFDEAKILSPGDKAKNLALGHSRLCMALGAGARYSDTSDSTLHAAAVQNLESAAKYYLKANLQSAAEYAKASKLLFDSYAYMNKAGSEEDQEKKTKLYTMAEKVLQASVSSYEKAGQPGRKEQVLKILAKVKEDRELAMSLAEVFLAPDIVSTAMAFPSPAPTHETAVGLDRFEHADVQATLIAKPKELHVGQELSLEIELINAGRGPAQLTKVEAIIPKGFLVIQEPEKYRMEDSQINLKGRRLDALKTEDVRLVVKPSSKGRFRLNPRIMYLDDSGANRTCEPAPVEIVVKEMGISGWIKGT